MATKLPLTHEDAEQAAKRGDLCCGRKTSTSWWISVGPEGATVLCDAHALAQDRRTEATNGGGGAGRYGLTRIPTRAQRGNRASMDAANIGTD